MVKLKVVRNKHNTPAIIKYPFWQMTLQNRRATYACINQNEAYAPPQIAARSICIPADIGDALAACREASGCV